MKQETCIESCKVIIFSLIFIFEVHATTQNFETIRIEGNQKFTNQITSALNLLKQKSPDKYQLVKSSTNTIKQSEKLQVEFENYPSILEISDEYTFFSIPWCASIIANYAKRYNDYMTAYGGSIPQDFWSSFNAITQSHDLQIVVLKNLQAPKSTIEFVQKQYEERIEKNFSNNEHQKNQFDKVTIIGTPQFNLQIVAALTLLKLKSKESYLYINEQIDTIQQAKENNLRFYEKPTILEISYEGASHSVTWCATTLLHYALQAYQAQTDSNHWNSPKNLSRNIKTLTQTLIKIGAPKKEIKILRSLNETAIDDTIYNETYQNKDFDKISVQGDLKFTQQIISALKILKLNSPNNYSYVNNYITLIKQAPETVLNKSLTNPVLHLNNKTAFKSLLWVASKIVYEAYKSFLFQKYVNTYDFTVPKENWKNTEAHFYATNTQLLALHDIDPKNKQIKKLVAENVKHINESKKQIKIGNIKDRFEGISISGNKEFIKQLKDSLTLLKQKSPENYTRVKNHIDGIRQSKQSNLDADAKPFIVELSTDDAMHSLYWCAISVVYHAYFIETHHEKKPYQEKSGTNKNETPESTWNNKELNSQAVKIQLSVLHDLQAPEYIIDYLNTLIGNNKVLPIDGNRQNSHFDGILINGSTEYNHQIIAALKMLKNKVPINYQEVKNNVGIIKQSKTSGMDVHNNPPLFNFSKESALYSLTYCASSIVHDAHHSYLYKRYKNIYHEAYGNNLPYKIWAGFNGELRAIEVQLSIMYAINAPIVEINHLKSSDGTHGDVNQDGKITDEDYRLSDW